MGLNRLGVVVPPVREPTPRAKRAIEAGRHAFGESWQADFARCIGRSPRVVNMWTVGDSQPSEVTLTHIKRCLISRGSRMIEAASKV